MIFNGTVTHGLSPPPLSTFQFNSPTLHAFTLAALTTILSYQSAALTLDIILGFNKPSGEASFSSIALLHFTTQTSFLSVITALFNTRTLTKWRYHGFKGNIGTCTAHVGADGYVRKGKLSVSVVAKLLFLLAAVPLLNLLSIALSLEIDDTLSFKDAKFGGIAMGVVNSIPPTTLRNINCRQFNTRFESNEVSQAEFLLCIDTTSSFRSIENASVIFSIEAGNRGDVRVSVYQQKNNVTFEAVTIGNLRVGKELYRFRNRMSKNEVEGLLMDGLRTLRRACKSVEEEEGRVTVEENRGVIKAEVTFLCFDAEPRNISEPLRAISSRVVLVEDEKLEVLKIAGSEGVVKNGKYIDGEELPLVKRRRPPVSFMALIIIVGVVMTLRQMVKAVTRNDIVLGIEIILKDWLGIGVFESMLRRKEIVRFVPGDMGIVGGLDGNDGEIGKREGEVAEWLSSDEGEGKERRNGKDMRDVVVGEIDSQLDCDSE